MCSEENTECDSMRLAFEQFMMSKGGSGSTGCIDKKSMEEKAAALKAKDELARRNKMKMDMKRSEKKYWQMFRCFYDTIRNEWMDLDDQLEQVVSSMAGIRSRLPMESCLLDRFTDKAKKNEWACAGNNQVLLTNELDQVKINNNQLFMKEEDVLLAISHDLLQHEKMMECLRSLFANLSDCHEALSRTLDGLMKHHLQVCEELLLYEESEHESHITSSSLRRAMDLVNLLNETFGDLSLELHRKQILVSLIFESVKDDLFREDVSMDQNNLNEVEFGLENLGPSKVMFKISRQWPRTSKWSQMNMPQLETLFKVSSSNRSND